MLPTYVSMVPAYGRDYKSKKALLEDWNAGKDFQLQTIHDNRYTSIRDVEELKKEGVKSLNIRYDRLTKICVIKL